MSKKSLLTESEIARFKELAGIPLSTKETKMLHENKYSVAEMKHDKKDKKKHEKEELDEAYDELDEAKEEEEGEEEEEMEGGEEEGGDEELDLGDMEGGAEGLDAGDELDSGEMGGGDAESLIQSILSQLGELAKKVGVNMEISGGDHAEPDADNMGGPSDMDADNMGDMEGGEDEEMDMGGEEDEEELNEGMDGGGITDENVKDYVMSKLAPFRDLREHFADMWATYSRSIIKAGVTQGALIELAVSILDSVYSEPHMRGSAKRRAVLKQLDAELVPLIPEEDLDEGREELDELRYVVDREEDPRAADRLSESALRQIAQRVNSRLSASISPTTRKKIVETITNRVAARLIAEAKKAKKGIKEKMKAKKDMKAMKEGAKKAGKGHGPGKKTFGTKESVANQYKLNKVKLPKNKGGKDTVVAKGGASGTLPKGAGKGGKASKSNTTN